MLVGVNGLFQTSRKRVIELAAEHHIPAMYRSADFVDAGGADDLRTSSRPGAPSPLIERFVPARG
jgi:hypothetical protein